MSKRDLKKYLAQLDKEQLEEQLLELYDKFPEVKTYYDFVFRPNEEKLLGAAKAKILNEYFPQRSKRPKLRRSTAQKFIKHFLTLGMDPGMLIDLMLYNVETAQRYTAKREIKYASFYKSMSSSFSQLLDYTAANHLLREYRTRLEAIVQRAAEQQWEHADEMADRLDQATRQM